ncbi:hypothetical protein KAT36_03170 [Candidatus Pacearchaeota archaeon]|nr:hypothetical protein [Candidatus Pacearchaeota archaeon]
MSLFLKVGRESKTKVLRFWLLVGGAKLCFALLVVGFSETFGFMTYSAMG